MSYDQETEKNGWNEAVCWATQCGALGAQLSMTKGELDAASARNSRLHRNIISAMEVIERVVSKMDEDGQDDVALELSKAIEHLQGEAP